MSGTIRPGESAAPSAAARAELARFAASVDAAGEWEATVAAFGTYYHEGFDFDPWRHVAFRIERCVAEGRPASFIRLGDAEGNLLALSLDDFPALANHCASALSCLYFGRPDALALAAPEVLPPLQTAVKNADVVGFPGPFGGPILLQQAVDTYVRFRDCCRSRDICEETRRRSSSRRRSAPRRASTAGCCLTTEP
jgi:hypothetical protein